MTNINTQISTQQHPEIYLDIESADGIMTPKVEGEILDAFAEPPRQTTPDVQELREVFEADQVEAAEQEEDSAPELIITEASKKIEKPRFGSARPERKPKIDLLDPRTRLGRFVSMAFFGEKSVKTSKENFNPVNALAKQNRKSRKISEQAGGPLSQRALQKLRDEK